MKNWSTQILGICALLFAFSACEKDETKITLTPSNAPTLAASTNSIVLVQGSSSRTAVTYTWTPVNSFAWSEAEHPYSPTVTYALEVDKQGNNFASPATIDAGKGPTTVVNYGGLNTALNTLGVKPAEPTPVEVRLRASYAPNSAVYSPAIPLIASSFECKAPTNDTWAIVGSAADGWPGSPDPVTDAPLTYDCDTRTYTITRALKVGEFKFRANKAWDVDYGANPQNADGTGTLVAKGANIVVSEDGNYTIVLDFNKMTYTLTK